MRLRVDNEFLQLQEQLRAESLHSVSQRTGKTMQIEDVGRLLDTLEKRYKTVLEMRLDHIKLKNRFRKQEDALRSKVIYCHTAILSPRLIFNLR